MNLVIDANILMSALISTEGKTFDLIFNENFNLVAPKFLMDEINKYKKEILSKSGLSEKDFMAVFSSISGKINIVPKNDSEDFVEKAKQISPDKNDAEYFAIALKLNCAIWSNDKRLKEQDKVKVYSTKELIDGISD